MPLDILVGAQWGDEGKGKVVDCLNAEHSYDVVVRFQGGANAGHTLTVGGTRHVLHLIPSGILNPHTVNVIGAGLVVDPIALLAELRALQQAGVGTEGRIRLSALAHWILPTHQHLDKALEQSRTGRHIGSTLRGIGPAYQDKMARIGLRVGDSLQPDFAARYRRLRDYHYSLLEVLGYDDTPSAAEEEAWLAAVEELRPLIHLDVERFLWDALEGGQAVLAEGAQGVLLDVSFGTYPYVTSSHTMAPSALVGAGIPHRFVRNVIGVFKAYTTRVGEGPFPTELEGTEADTLRRRGGEFGATTARPRRIGWLDLEALQFAVRLSGCNQLIMTKADILVGLDSVPVGTAYVRGGQRLSFEEFLVWQTVDAVEYRRMEGWTDTSAHNKALRRYVCFIEESVGVPVVMVSTGPERESFWRPANDN